MGFRDSLLAFATRPEPLIRGAASQMERRAPHEIEKGLTFMTSAATPGVPIFIPAQARLKHASDAWISMNVPLISAGHAIRSRKPRSPIHAADRCMLVATETDNRRAGRRSPQGPNARSGMVVNPVTIAQMRHGRYWLPLGKPTQFSGHPVTEKRWQAASGHFICQTRDVRFADDPTQLCRGLETTDLVDRQSRR